MAYTRAQDLYQHHALAQQNLEQAASAEVQASGDLAAAEAALKVLGVTDLDAMLKGPPSFEIPVIAPIQGEVVEQNVAAGQLLQAGATQCFMISNTGTVWVLVNVYQQDLPYVRVGDPVTIQTDPIPTSSMGAFLIRGGLGSEHAHSSGTYRDRQSGGQAQERHVCTRHG